MESKTKLLARKTSLTIRPCPHFHPASPEEMRPKEGINVTKVTQRLCVRFHDSATTEPFWTWWMTKIRLHHKISTKGCHVPKDGPGILQKSWDNRLVVDAGLHGGLRDTATVRSQLQTPQLIFSPVTWEKHSAIARQREILPTATSSVVALYYQKKFKELHRWPQLKVHDALGKGPGYSSCTYHKAHKHW